MSRRHVMARALYLAVPTWPSVVLPAVALFLPCAALAAAGSPYRIPAGPLGPVVNQIITGSGLALAAPAALLEGRHSPGVAQADTPEQALEHALRGTGLQVIMLPGDALGLQLVPAPPADVAQLDDIVVRGSLGQPASEATGEYAATAVSLGKEVVSLREIPQSVSVLTRAQLDDRAATSLGDAMNYVTGIRVLATSTGVVNLRSRGFRLNNYLLDGMPLRGGQGMWGSALMDMALYDRVEVWRGPAALLEGAGEPSGTLNLARKRADATRAFRGAALVGSWDRYRLEADMTGALNADGSLRGRIVAVHDQSRSFVDAVFQRAQTLYATLEYDFSPNTTLSAGLTRQRGRSVVFAGLPLVAGGAAPDVARSTFLGSRHGIKHDRGHSAFVELEHHLANGGRWRTHINQYVTRNQLDRFIANSMIDPITRAFEIEGAWQKSTQINRGLDTFVTLPFEAAGRSHTLTAGANAQIFKGGQIQQRHGTWRQNVDAPEHDLRLPWRDIGEPPEPVTREYGGYASVRLRPSDRLTLLAGGRLAWWESRDPDRRGNDQTVRARFVPNAGVLVDLDARWTAYASYNRIFSPQTERTAEQHFLSPRTGTQVEIGLKGELARGRVNTHLALFRIDDRGRAIDDPDHVDASIAAGRVRSQGVEAEITGRLHPRWDLTAGYAYTVTRHRDLAPGVDATFDSTFPRHQFSLWSRWRVSGDEHRGAFLGIGARTASGTYADFGGVRWRQGGHTVVALQAGYAWGEALSATLTLDNAFDKHYFARFAGGAARQTYYGEPRRVTLALRSRF